MRKPDNKLLKNRRITFDSNVWRKVASPKDFPKDLKHTLFAELNNLCKSGQIIGCLSESIFSLEGIMKVDRKEIIGNDRGKVERKNTEFSGDVVKSGFTIGPDFEAHPGSGDYLKKHLNDARLVNFKILYCPRLAGIKNRDLTDSDFLNFSQEISDKFADVVSEIESWGCGQTQIRAIGYKYAESWLDGIKIAPQSEKMNIAKAIAEWADADSLAAHIAYGNHIFCTYDEAKSAGNDSVFSTKHIALLTNEYGLDCRAPEYIFQNGFLI
jgi:hypothetical protein